MHPIPDRIRKGSGDTGVEVMAIALFLIALPFALVLWLVVPHSKETNLW